MHPVASMTTKQEPNWRVPTMRRSIIGSRRLISQGIINTNASAAIAAQATMKVEANQSSTRPRSSTISSAPRKVAISRNPMRSKCCRRRSLAVVRVRRIAEMSAIATRPTGPLIRKHQCQE